jgi:zinc transporter ZupT
VLQVTTIGGQSASTDPAATIYTTETILNTGLPVTVGIEARNIPAGTTVNVRIVPARGAPFTATSTPLVQQGGGVLTATATVTFPSGKSEIQLRANWTP